MSSQAIRIRGLTKTFPGFSLGPVDLSVPRGAIYGLIGPNGSGKSTTLDLLFGMGSPDAGTLEAAGFNALLQEKEMKQRVTYSSPDTQFAVWGTVGRAVRFVQEFYPTWDAGYCSKLMADFRLAAADKIGTLSFGARTKLSLLLALSPRPEVIVLDEPTTGLDPESRKILFEELLRFVSDEQRTVLISSHQLSDLERFADHVGVLSEGALICSGPTSDLVARHVLVEYSLAEGRPQPQMPGFHRRATSGLRYQAVVDLEMHPVATLNARGLHVYSQIQLPLEEIFIALTTKRRELQPC
jgi:ABC-2 type transport system ATP-binding protein